jgi:adenylate kinase
VKLLVLGPQGAGKGTQAKRIADEYSLPHISTGDMFRSAIAAQTELGKQVEPLLAAGRLVPDDVTIELIRERLGGDDAADGFVLDGFPRTVAQAQSFDELLKELGLRLDAILFFDLPDEVATERLLKRGAEDSRVDDTPEVIAQRLRTYHEQTEPIVEHYRVTGRLVPLHADRSIDEVWSEIQDALERVEDAA